jgi:hypothetical protein
MREKLSVSFLALVLVLTSACASRGRGVQLTQTCAALENVKLYCSSAINKPKQLRQVCDNAPLASLLCAVGTVAQPSVESAAAAASISHCPPEPSPECIGALVASQSWRMLTNDRKKQLLTCAEYINQAEACR